MGKVFYFFTFSPFYSNLCMQDKYLINSQLSFNSSPPSIMHIDLNSCFARIEQQANPHLRGRPVAVAAYVTSLGCIIAPSVEAKKLGIKVGMRVKEGRLLCKDLIILPPDPWKYRDVHLGLRRLLSDYTDNLTPKSIDEFVLSIKRREQISMCGIAGEIKKRIKEEIGDWLTVSIGIAPNRFLAKLASNLHKPDGLDEINKLNFLDCFLKVELTDLPYIKARNALRLNSIGINTVVDFYNAPLWKLKAAFASINSYYWYLRIRGYEIDDILYARRSYGNSYALPKPLSKITDLSPIVSKLTEKMSFRLRRAGYMAKGVHLAIGYRNGFFWHKAVSFEKELFESGDIYKKVLRVLYLNRYKFPVRDIAVSVFGLKKITNLQLNFFEDVLRKRKLSEAVDRINERWGNFIIAPGRMLCGDTGIVPDRIAFGGVKELEEFTMQEIG
jgi:DNA polymerase-4